MGFQVYSKSVNVDMEKEYILRVLKDANGNQSKASHVLGIDRKTLYLKLKKYGTGFSSSTTNVCASNACTPTMLAVTAVPSGNFPRSLNARAFLISTMMAAYLDDV